MAKPNKPFPETIEYFGDEVPMDPNNPVYYPHIVLDYEIYRSNLYNWTEKVLIAAINSGITKNRHLANLMGFEVQTIRNIKSSITRKAKEARADERE